MPRRRPETPSRLPEAFTVAEAGQLGVGRSALRGDDFETIFHGGRRRRDLDPAGPDDAPYWARRSAEFEQLISAYIPLMPPHAFLCGTTAAHLWQIPLPSRVPAVIEVGVFRLRTAPVRPGLRGRQFTASFVLVTDLGGIRVTDPASTWASLGRTLREDELIVAADHVLHIPRHPGGFRPVTESALADRERLERFAERRGRPGAPALRRALEHARTGSASPPETQIRLLIRDAGLPEPVLDHDVYDGRGRFLGCSELAYPDLRVAIEYESDGHLLRHQLERDIDKYQAYAEAGWVTVRLTSEHVYRSPHEAIRRIREACRRADRDSGPSISAV
ncbi:MULTISPECIES: hypothetical protein [unclassified Microbacterium]|uniref:hypothetical protein n=1 Tax=unclassified Microbacterium TaxID=2609290 RepID=UPI00343A31EA